MNKSHNSYERYALSYACFGTFAGAILHIAALLAGPNWIAFVGAPASIVQSAKEGTWLAPISTLGISALLIVMSAYAFIAMKKHASFPFVKTVLITIACVFKVRGLLVIVYLHHLNLKTAFGLFHFGASLFILTLGIAYAIGAHALWRTQK